MVAVWSLVAAVVLFQFSTGPAQGEDLPSCPEANAYGQPEFATRVDSRHPSSPATEADQFRCRVLNAQYRLSIDRGASSTAHIDAGRLEPIASEDALPRRSVTALKELTPRLRQLLRHCRHDLAGDRALGIEGSKGVVDVRIRSAYRSATEQSRIWHSQFAKYYRRTELERQELRGGPHGSLAVRRLAEYIDRRLFAPGFSQHQKGLAIDFTFRTSAGWAPADTSSAGLRLWKDSWLFQWLNAHAWEYDLRQNPYLDEPWHWEFRPVVP